MKQMRLDKISLYNYVNKNNIQYTKAMDLCGCLVLREIILVDKCGECFVLERFDGAKYLVSEEELKKHERVLRNDETLVRSYDVANICYDSNFNYHIKNHYNRLSYIPTYMSIVNYIRKYCKMYDYEDLEYENIDIKAVNLPKGQINSYKAKLTLLGVPWLQVDYNTIALPKSNKLVEIYTQQKTVKTYSDFDGIQ
jgi:hypothetical protein